MTKSRQAYPYTVIGAGGHVRGACNGYNESARIFMLYLDNEPVGDLLRYGNHCEGGITLTSTTVPGSHSLSAQQKECEFEFQVAAQ